MKQIPVGREGLFALVDDDDYEWLSSFTWGVLKPTKANGSYTYYAKWDSRGQDSRRFTTLMHRMIMDPEPNKDIDHINGNGLDNRKENLRVVDHTQSRLNQIVHKNSRSGIRCVRKVGNRYRAYCVVDKKQIHLGYYDTPEEASIAVTLFMKDLYGDYYRTRQRLEP